MQCHYAEIKFVYYKGDDKVIKEFVDIDEAWKYMKELENKDIESDHSFYVYDTQLCRMIDNGDLGKDGERYRIFLSNEHITVREAKRYAKKHENLIFESSKEFMNYINEELEEDEKIKSIDEAVKMQEYERTEYHGKTYYLAFSL